MISKFIKNNPIDVDVDLQIVATELDTSVNDLKYIDRNSCSDAIKIENFDSLMNDIEDEEVYSFDDNTVLYTYCDEPVIIFTTLTNKFVIFDKSMTLKMHHRLSQL